MKILVLLELVKAILMLLENVLIAANPGMAFWIKSWIIDKRIVDLGWYC